MALINFRKETSERSDETNWAKSLLIEKSGYFLESIEGCNQNKKHVVTHLIERARVDFVPDRKASKEEVIAEIKQLEGEDALQRKLNFAKCYGLPLSYALYCDENEHVYFFNFHSLSEAKVVRIFKSYQEFADWIYKIKGWKSKKPFREIADLPNFDKALRKAGTPWPTNIDCFICDETNKPVAILEFQNAQNVGVANHCNNDYFLCLMRTIKHGIFASYPVYHDDIRRWTSQEILRVQSNLRYFIITWAQQENDFILKEVDVITIPYIPDDGKLLLIYEYKSDLHKYVIANRPKAQEDIIANTYKSYNLEFKHPAMNMILNHPLLSYADRTFPSIYYKSKELVQGDKEILVSKFTGLLNS